MSSHAIGIDYGTNSVRALVVDCKTGQELGTSVWSYERGEAGIVLDRDDPNLARQHPADYIKGLEIVVKEALAQAAASGVSAETIVGIGVDTTGSTPIPVDAEGVPLAFKDEFKDNPNAYAWLWKDHTSHAEAARITELAREMRPEYLARCGGVYSSEWFWSKILRCLHADRAVFDAAASWVECCDFIPAWLAGNTRPEDIRRSVCAAGHKAMYAPDWGGLPDDEFLGALAPELAALRARLYEFAYTSDIGAGSLSSENARLLGLATGTPVAVGVFDAHTGAVGAGIKPGMLVKVIGTSTCDMAVQLAEPPVPEISGLCGIVDGSILPGMYGFEAGQSAVGDIFNWFVRFAGSSHEALTEASKALRPGASGLVALDWHNGNRTVLVDPNLTGLVAGLTLRTTAAEVYRALIEATAFGARVIVERLVSGGVRLSEIVACGGIAEKNDLLMQIYADVLKLPMKVSRSSQTCALGAAVFGAVVGGAHATAEDAQERMTGLKDVVYEPDAERSAVYDRLYAIYRALHDGMGTSGERDFSRVMKDLIAVRAGAMA